MSRTRNSRQRSSPSFADGQSPAFASGPSIPVWARSSLNSARLSRQKAPLRMISVSGCRIRVWRKRPNSGGRKCSEHDRRLQAHTSRFMLGCARQTTGFHPNAAASCYLSGRARLARATPEGNGGFSPTRSFAAEGCYDRRWSAIAAQLQCCRRSAVEQTEVAGRAGQGGGSSAVPLFASAEVISLFQLCWADSFHPHQICAVSAAFGLYLLPQQM